jgi:hypothetical protein
LKQAVWDAFAGTGQPTFAEAGSAPNAKPLTLVLDEVGLQVRQRRQRLRSRARLPPGRYVRVVRVRASLNPRRKTLLVGKPFTVVAGG